MEIIIYKENIDKNIGVLFDEDEKYFFRIKQLIDDLTHDNKNYKNSQYYKLLDIKEILDNMEVIYDER